jgi:5'-3' exonuclease
VAPELQLLAVLPAQSALLLPEVLRPLVEDERHMSREFFLIFGGWGGL